MQALIDDKIFDLKTSNDPCGEDTSLEQDHVDKPMPSSGSLPSSTSSNIHASPKALNLSNIPSSNMLSNIVHARYSHSRGLPLKDTQANLHLAANIFNNVEPKEPKPLYAIMPTLACPSPSLPKSSIQFQ